MKNLLFLLLLAMGCSTMIVKAQTDRNLSATTDNNAIPSMAGESYETADDDTKPKKESYRPESPDEQAGKPLVIDGIYERTIGKERKILPYEDIREADVFWQKRIWRMIDTRQKMNEIFVTPTAPFIKILLDVAQKHEDAYIFSDEDFTVQTKMSEVQQTLGSIDTIRVIDPETYEETIEVVTNEFNWEAVQSYRLKEDWVFDEESSRMIVRILGIAPIMDVIDDNGNYRGQRAMFWAYYPSFRQYLVTKETFNRQNDGIRLTWEDVLEARMFSSFIVKESNIQDRRIKDYATGRDALIESERIRNELFEREHNLWSY